MKKANEQSMGELAEAAFERVVDRVIKRAKDAGTQVIVGKDGVLVALDPEEARWEARKKAKPSGSH